MRKRSLFLVGVPILALVLVVALLLAVRSTAQPPPVLLDDRSAASAAAPQAEVAAPTAGKPAANSEALSAASSLAPPAPTALAAPDAGTDADAGLVALVDGEALHSDRLALMQAVDQVMSALLGSEPATAGALLDQMINHALVMQQMVAVEPETPAADGEAAARLDALLGAAGKTEADLTLALSASTVDRTTFDQYFAELIGVDDFARRGAAAAGVALDVYIAGLQSAARISYGPAAAQPLAFLSLPPQSTAPITAAQTSPPISSTPASALATGPPVAGRGIAAGQLAPDFALDTLGEDGQTTFDDLLGKPLVLSFWTTWCPYCLRQTPVLVAAANGYAGDIRFVGIDVAEDAGVVAAYAAEHAIPYPVLLDRASQAAAAYAVNGFPTTYFLDASGHIIAHHIGSLSEAELKQYVEQLRRPRS